MCTAGTEPPRYKTTFSTLNHQIPVVSLNFALRELAPRGLTLLT